MPAACVRVEYVGVCAVDGRCDVEGGVFGFVLLSVCGCLCTCGVTACYRDGSKLHTEMLIFISAVTAVRKYRATLAHR